MDRLEEIERSALAIFAAHNLHCKRAHCGKSPRARCWTFIAEHLSAEERWRLALERPGWRFATLEDLGGQAAQPSQVRKAARMLATCAMVGGRLPSGLAAEVEAAIRLGHDWREVRRDQSTTPATPRLKILSIAPVRGPRS